MDFSILSFPFAQIGTALRRMSLDSPAGNSAALGIYLLISLLPVLYLVFRVLIQKKELDVIDLILPAASALLFVLMYLMVNPGYLNSELYGAQMTGRGAAIAVTFWSVIACYVVLRVMKNISGGSEKSLAKSLKFVLTLAMAVCVLRVGRDVLLLILPAVSEPAELTAVLDFSAAVTAAVSFLAKEMPIILNIVIMGNGIKLVRRLEADRYSVETLAAAGRLGKTCVAAVFINILTTVCANGLQVFFAKQMEGADFAVNLPLGSIILALVILLLIKYFAADREMKEENDLMI